MILLGLGSNLSSELGNRFYNINQAILLLKKYKINLLNKSSYYETPSYPNTKNPKFINLVLSVNSDLDPAVFASKLILVEESLGRKRYKKNDPRTIDIDILDYKNKIINFYYNGMEFEVPHKKLHLRNFVLYPMQEILPAWIHPKIKQPINSLIDKLSDVDKKSILKIRKA